MDKCQRIRSLFLDPADSYSLREVATLTDTPARTLRREVAEGLRDAEKVRGKWRFLWRQAAYVAMDCFTLAEIQDALGSDAANVLPPLLALRTVTVRLPEYIVLALEAVAAVDQTTIDAALGFELVEFAGTHLTDRLAGDDSRLPGGVPVSRSAVASRLHLRFRATLPWVRVRLLTVLSLTPENLRLRYGQQLLNRSRECVEFRRCLTAASLHGTFIWTAHPRLLGARETTASNRCF
jgi:hypothetical protein